MSRGEILKNIQKSKPELIPLPEFVPLSFTAHSDLLDTFLRSVEAVGGKAVVVKNEREISERIKAEFPDAKEIISLVEYVDMETVDRKMISSSRDLDRLDLAIVNGQFGVAENGAVWVSDKNIFHRSIPFITSHLAIVIDNEHLVENMIDACERISNFNEGFGVFISGPSKTADIEQSLVIGAQGALSLTVYMLLRG
jgi:L-lactate dehydrogenase complex protein LldG